MPVEPEMIITDKMLSDAINAMDGQDFDFHKLILKVAHDNQADYVRALYAEVGKDHKFPFGTLHLSLGGRVRQLAKAVNYNYYPQHSSSDIFGHNNDCANYSKT